MKRAIWKYPLEMEETQELQIPQGAEFLSMQLQHGVPCMWFSVNPKSSVATVTVTTVGTGHDYYWGGNFAGTYQMQQGQFVFHVFWQWRKGG